MWQTIAGFGNSIDLWLSNRRWQAVVVLALLAIQAGLLAYSATRHSPTQLEPAFLAAGISHWEFGRFELYRVNPPLPRMIAAIPVLVVGCETDWRRFNDRAGSRSEFPVGEDFVKANGARSIPLFFFARWACIPFSLIGGWFAYCWSKELYGDKAGLLTLVLWVFEPNLLAHAELVTPDCACWSLGILAGYSFWRWLRVPTWTRAGLAGLSLGLAELTKFTWVFLFGLWPALWICWVLLSLKSSGKRTAAGHDTSSPQVIQLTGILLLGLYVLNLGYGFSRVGTPVGEFTFISKAFTGRETSGDSGNRFRHSWLGSLPVPVPQQYILGFDSQQRDFEDYGRRSFLRGEWKADGWWYYYIYGLYVKVPCGLWGLFIALVFYRLFHSAPVAEWKDELILLAPGAALLLICTSRTEINEHLRYVFPSLAIVLIWLGQSAVLVCNTLASSHHGAKRLIVLVFLGLIAHSISSAIAVYPHQITYFNEFVGGPRNGWKHLRGSSVDWGQDLLYVTKHELKHACCASSYRGSGSSRSILAAVRWFFAVSLTGPSCNSCGTIVSVSSSDFDIAAKSSEVVWIGFSHVVVSQIPSTPLDHRAD